MGQRLADDVREQETESTIGETLKLRRDRVRGYGMGRVSQ